MVYRLFGSVGSLLALCVLQAMMAPTLMAQQSAPRPNAYLRQFSADGQPARTTPRPARNLGDVFAGGAKSGNSTVRHIVNEEQIPQEETVLEQDAPVRRSETPRPARNLGNVAAGGAKSRNSVVRRITNEEQMPQEETVLKQEAPVRPSESVRRGETIKPGVSATNGSVFESHGEVYEGDTCNGCCDEYAACCTSSCCGSYYARAEFLYWWLSGDAYPPLVTTSPDDTPRVDAGVLGEDDTSILFGNDTLNGGGRAGVRTVFGVYLTDCTRLEGDWFTLGSKGSQFNHSSDGDPILARPFFNLSSGQQDANLIAYPGVFDGRIDIRANTEFMGAGIHLARNLSYCGDCCGYHKLDFVYGFRYLGLYEDFSVNTTSEVEGQSTAPIGTVFSVHDAFSTSNSFFGGNVGVSGEANRGRWYFTGAARLGIGGTREKVAVGGSTRVRQPGEDGATFDGGLLAMPTNIGKYSTNAFGLVPHLELRVAYCVTRQIKWTVGYDLMYWSRVVRPGDQISLFVNPTQGSGQELRGTPGPLFPFKETDLWITGVSTGFEFTF